MADSDIELKITADIKDLDSSLKQIGQSASRAEPEISAMERAFKRLERTSLGPAISGVKKLEDNLRSLGKAAAVTATAVAGAYATNELIKFGSAVARTETAFETMAASSGVSAIKLLQDMQGASRGLTSDFDLMQRSIQAVSFGVPADQLAALTEEVTNYARITGRNVPEALDRMARGFGKLETEILDELGLTIKLGQAKKQYAAEIGIAVSAMTAEQEKIAFVNAGLEQLRANNEKLGVAQLTTADQGQKGWAQLSNEVAKAAKYFAESETAALLVEGAISIMSGALDAAVGTYKLLEPLVEAGAGAIWLFGEAVEAVGWAIKAPTDGIKGLGEEIRDLIRPEAAAKLEAYTGLIEDLGSAAQNTIDQLSSSFQGLGQSIKDSVVSFYEENKSKIQEVIKTSEQYQEQVLSLQQDLLGLSETERKIAALRTSGMDQNSEVFKNQIAQLEQIQKLEKQIQKQNQTREKESRERARREEEREKESRERARREEEREKEKRKNRARERKEQKEITDSYKKMAQEFANTAKYKDIWEDYSKGLISYDDALRDVRDSMIGYQAITAESARATADLNKAAEGFSKGGGSFEDLADSMLKAEQAGEKLQKFGKEVQKDQGFFGGLLSGLGVNPQIFSDLFDENATEATAAEKGEAAARLGAQAFNQAFEEGINRDNAAELGGTAVGAAVASQFGPAAGEAARMVSTILFDSFSGWGKDSKGSELRKSVDKFFADAFEANRIALLINGELKQIDDLSIKPFLENISLDLLEDNVRDGFNGVGLALEGIFGKIGELSQNGIELGRVLAANLGGDLNTLQQFLIGAGVSAEQLEDQLIKAFMAGDLSAVEVSSSLAEVDELFKVGIPGSIGDTQQAFTNFINSGGRGLPAIDSMRDLAAEALETGGRIQTLGDLQADLLAKGADPEQLKAFFAALDANGIDSLEKLRDISDRGAINIIGNLQTDNFAGFGDVASEMQKLSEYAENLDQEREIRVKIRADYSDEDIKAIESASGYKIPNIKSGGAFS